MSDNVRVPSIQCPRCDFNNPEGTEQCFDCGAALEPTPTRLITVRRRRHSATAISLSDLAAVRARVKPRSAEMARRATPTTQHSGARRVLAPTRSLGPPKG